MNDIDEDGIQGPIAIFWTGGWDSTYRVIELSHHAVQVQPVYILDETRYSHERELDAIATMTKLLETRSETKAEFLPLRVIRVEDIPEDEEMSRAAERLRKEFGLGIQHDWTARVAKEYPGIELCIEKALTGYMPIRQCINKYVEGGLLETAHGYMIDGESASEDVRLVLGGVTLPIFETTERQMLDAVKSLGCEDVMAHIWFCHRPIKGEPCGLCSPCHTKMDSDMEFLLPEKARERCRRRTAVEARWGGGVVAKVYGRIVRFLVGGGF